MITEKTNFPAIFHGYIRNIPILFCRIFKHPAKFSLFNGYSNRFAHHIA